MDLPKVSVVITAYLEKSKPYLDACVRSILNLNYPKDKLEIFIITPTWYKPEYEGCKTIHPCMGAYHNPVAVNFGMRQASKDSKFLLMLNDDVIMTRDSLKNMVQAAGEHDVVISPISNCDNGDFYSLAFPFGLVNRQYRIEDIRHMLSPMMNAPSPYSPGLVFPRTLYLYCNLYPKHVWERVGEFDENFKTGYDDTDWCMRAQKNGVRLAVALDALVWHMSGASADVTMGDLKSDLRAENEAYFRKKWGL